MRLQTLLQTPSMQKMRVIAGERGLKREISTIGMIESPDIANYLTAGQFLITNGYPFINNTDPTTLIQAMHAADCAGLGLKDQRYVDHLPQTVIDLADELALPIIVTPSDELISTTMRTMLPHLRGGRFAPLRAAESGQHPAGVAVCGAGGNPETGLWKTQPHLPEIL